MAERLGSASPVSRADLALGLGLGALLFFVLGWFFAGENDENGWLWFVMGALSLGAVVTGVMARTARKALIGLVIGGLLLLLFLLFATGILE